MSAPADKLSIVGCENGLIHLRFERADGTLITEAIFMPWQACLVARDIVETAGQLMSASPAARLAAMKCEGSG